MVFMDAQVLRSLGVDGMVISAGEDVSGHNQRRINEINQVMGLRCKDELS